MNLDYQALLENFYILRRYVYNKGVIRTLSYIPTPRSLSAGLSQAKRQIFSKGLVSNAATLLDFPPGDSNGASSSSLLPSASGLFAGGPAKGSSSKRKRSGSFGGSSSGSRKKASNRTAALRETNCCCFFRVEYVRVCHPVPCGACP